MIKITNKITCNYQKFGVCLIISTTSWLLTRLIHPFIQYLIVSAEEVRVEFFCMYLLEFIIYYINPNTLTYKPDYCGISWPGIP